MGCSYILVSGEETVEGVAGITVPDEVELPVFDFERVLVFDYRDDDTVQDIPIVRNTSVIQLCSVTRDRKGTL